MGRGRLWDGEQKEFRKAIAALGYDAPKPDVDEVFTLFDADGSGEVSLKELKAALSGQPLPRTAPKKAAPAKGGGAAAGGVKKGGDKVVAANRVSGGAKPAKQAPTGGGGEDYDAGSGPEDVAGEEEEENFEAGMHRAARDYEAHDVDQDNKLDFGEFCAMVRSREEGNFTEEQLQERFASSISTARARSICQSICASRCARRCIDRRRVMDLFRQRDEDVSGTIDKKEFRRAIQALGFDYFDEVS